MTAALPLLRCALRQASRAIVLCGLLIAAQGAGAQQQPLGPLARTVGFGALVLIDVQGAGGYHEIGSGWLFTADGYVITANHLFPEDPINYDVTARPVDATPKSARVGKPIFVEGPICRNKLYDFAIGRLKDVPQTLAPLHIDQQYQTYETDKVFALGFIRGMIPAVAGVEINGISLPNLYGTGGVVPSYSGGPLIAKSLSSVGFVLGVTEEGGSSRVVDLRSAMVLKEIAGCQGGPAIIASMQKTEPVPPLGKPRVVAVTPQGTIEETLTISNGLVVKKRTLTREFLSADGTITRTVTILVDERDTSPIVVSLAVKPNKDVETTLRPFGSYIFSRIIGFEGNTPAQGFVREIRISSGGREIRVPRASDVTAFVLHTEQLPEQPVNPR